MRVLKETGKSYGQTFVCSDNPGQNIWHEVGKHSKIGQNYKNFITTFACFLLLLPKFNLWKEYLDTNLCLHQNMKFF